MSRHKSSASKTLCRGAPNARRWRSPTRESGEMSAEQEPPMAQSVQQGRFGHSGKPDDAWLAKQEKEPIFEPELPIIDTHHHLWDRCGTAVVGPICCRNCEVDPESETVG